MHAIALQPDVARRRARPLPAALDRASRSRLTNQRPRAAAVPPVRPAGFHTCDFEPALPPTPTRCPPPAGGAADGRGPPVRLRPGRPARRAGGLADLCAARADVVAVLGLPRHARMTEAQQLADVLSSRPGRQCRCRPASRASGIRGARWSSSAHRPLPLAAGAARRRAPRARFRPPNCRAAGGSNRPDGRWQASSRPISSSWPTTVALFDRGLNVVRRRPAGFAATSAHSVSTDRTLLQLSVRRLLIYVASWPFGRAFGTCSNLTTSVSARRWPPRSPASSNGLRIDGGAGRLPGRGRTARRRASLADEGKLRVDLKLAPTSPIEFITVTLLRSATAARAGDGLMAASAETVDAPFTAFSFEVVLTLATPMPGIGQPVCQGAFAECDGLQLELEAKAVRQGGANDSVTHLMGQTRPSQLTLRRGMTTTSDLWAWAAPPAFRAHR